MFSVSSLLLDDALKPATPLSNGAISGVKFGRREMGKIVCCLRDKKENFAWLSSSRYCADHAQNLPGPATDNVLRVLQISSKSVHFRCSYIRTRKHRQSALASESNLRLKLIASSRIINLRQVKSTS